MKKMGNNNRKKWEIIIEKKSKENVQKIKPRKKMYMTKSIKKKIQVKLNGEQINEKKEVKQQTKKLKQ